MNRLKLTGKVRPGTTMARESAGIVDLMAVRKDHATRNGDFERGDLFEIILIQIEGGGARWPNADDICRLRAVAKRYKARDVVLRET